MNYVALPRRVRKNKKNISEIISDETELSKMSDVPTRSVEIKYEYLDHTADVQLHAWGNTLAEAFEQVAICMFNYMTDLSTVETSKQKNIIVEGHDMDSLLFNFMDEWLFQFCGEKFIPNMIEITKFDRIKFVIECTGWGESFDLKKHPQGTEVKAMTYSAMQIIESEEHAELYVIVDI